MPRGGAFAEDDGRPAALDEYVGARADRLRPRWLVWENVPGVLSSAGGRDFGAFLGGLAELGYEWSYRVLDAQYFGLAQRRKRVFVVGYLGDWRPASCALFPQFDGLSWHPAPRRKAGERVADSLTVGANQCSGTRSDFVEADSRLAYGGSNCSGPIDVSTALNASGGIGRLDFESETFIAHALRGEGFDASEDGTGRGTPLVPVAFHPTQDPISSSDVCHALGTGSAQGCATAAVAFDTAQITSRANRTRAEPGLPVSTLAKQSRMHVAAAMQVRRLTPRECERLQGFPDDFTLVPYRGKPAADGPRYKALGNSMAVPVMHWIGRNIATVEEVIGERAALSASA